MMALRLPLSFTLISAACLYFKNKLPTRAISFAYSRRLIRLYAAHFKHPGRIKFLSTPSEGGTETGLAKHASTSLRKNTVSANYTVIHSISTADSGATRQTEA